MFLPKGTTYDVICNAGGEFAVINFLTDKEYNIIEFTVHEMNDVNKVRDEFLNMNRIFASELPFGFYSILSSLYGIFASLVSNFKKDRIPSVLEKALGYINDNIASAELTNSSVARSVGISEVYLRKLFAKHLSVPVGEYVIDARIKRAKSLLSETNLTVTEISEWCGYSSVYYFCSAFKSRVGYTPTAYRAGRRNDVI
jgi:AraC family transcriptional regulator